MPAKDVVDAFKRFDKDGNGQISLSELSFALQSLDPETWTDAAVQALMLLVTALRLMPSEVGSG